MRCWNIGLCDSFILWSSSKFFFFILVKRKYFDAFQNNQRINVCVLFLIKWARKSVILFLYFIWIENLEIVHYFKCSHPRFTYICNEFAITFSNYDIAMRSKCRNKGKGFILWINQSSDEYYQTFSFIHFDYIKMDTLPLPLTTRFFDKTVDLYPFYIHVCACLG